MCPGMSIHNNLNLVPQAWLVLQSSEMIELSITLGDTGRAGFYGGVLEGRGCKYHHYVPRCQGYELGLVDQTLRGDASLPVPTTQTALPLPG
jgi:hypothetical protein